MRSLRHLLTVSLFPHLFPVTQAADYAPAIGSCPSSPPTVRTAFGINPEEATYINLRSRTASTALATWLQNLNTGFSVNLLPTIALATSGGGYRSMLAGAGVIQALDSRDNSTSAPTKGLYQAITYQSGLSGGSWLLSAMIGNGFPTISTLNSTLWSSKLSQMDPLKDPEKVRNALEVAFQKYIASAQTGVNMTITDIWGLWTGRTTLPVSGSKSLLSSMSPFKGFQGSDAPFPIITSIGVNTWSGDVVPRPNGTQYEFTPYEFGSWDDGVHAFLPTRFIGTKMSNGVPENNSQCITNADNMAWIQGTSSNLFNECGSPNFENTTACTLADTLFKKFDISEAQEWYANYTNPFYGHAGSPLVSAQPVLNLVDGGESDQNNPIWPFLQPERNVDVLIVNDNSADINPGTIIWGGYPSGGALYNTSLAAQAAGLKKMPLVPQPNSTTLYQHAAFFGCDDLEALTIIYLPNNNFTYNSGTPSGQFAYSVDQINGMLENGNAVATQNGDAEWPICLACGLTKKTGEKMPEKCDACFEKYCWRGPFVAE